MSLRRAQEGEPVTDSSGAAGSTQHEIADQPSEHDGALSYMGRRIRELRRQQKLSLVQLSAACDTSVAMLSHIERGQTQPSLKTLDRIRQALGVPMTTLFPHSEETSPDLLTVVRHDSREHLEFPHIGLTKQKLSPNDDSDLEVLLLVLEPGGSSGQEPWARFGEKAGLVLKGSMQLDVGGEVFELATGDSFQFDSSKPHRFANTGDQTSEIVWIIKSSPLVRKLSV
jgi:transcriptional regulator with XRE-family HTH domain